MTIKEKLRLLAPLLLLFAVLGDCDAPRDLAPHESAPDPYAHVSPPDVYGWLNVAFEYVSQSCRVYAYEYGSYPFSTQGSDEALRLALRDVDNMSEKGVDAWLRGPSKTPGAVDFVYLNVPDAAKLPPDTIMLAEKVPSEEDKSRLWVALLQLPDDISGGPLLIGTYGLKPGEVVGRTLSEFHVYRGMYYLLSRGTATAIAVGVARHIGIDTSLYEHSIELDGPEGLGQRGWVVVFKRRGLHSTPPAADQFRIRVDRRDAATTYLDGP